MDNFKHLRFTREDITTAAEFVAEVNKVNTELNAAWAQIKATIPAGDQAAGETLVRTVLK